MTLLCKYCNKPFDVTDKDKFIDTRTGRVFYKCPRCWKWHKEE